MRSASSARSALATARATAPSLSAGVTRRGSVKSSSGSLGSVQESREALSASLKQETEKKEQVCPSMLTCHAFPNRILALGPVAK